MPGRVAGKIAIVVGAGQSPGEGLGNGRAVAMLLAREGAHVIAVDRDVDSARETCSLITAESGSATPVGADATSESDIERVMHETLATHARIDILHNNVGASIALGDAPADRLTEASFDRSFAVNLKSAWLAAKHALPAMRQQQSGSIVNISSLAAWEAYPLLGYKSMKAAVLALTQHLAAANARYGTRVNAILPGLMNTPMAIEPRVARGAQTREEVVAMRNKRVPLGHQMGTAWDVAYAALFLHSDEARFITGALLPVDGGTSASFGSYD